jgi:hypothetical protein
MTNLLWVYLSPGANALVEGVKIYSEEGGKIHRRLGETKLGNGVLLPLIETPTSPQEQFVATPIALLNLTPM